MKLIDQHFSIWEHGTDLQASRTTFLIVSDHGFRQVEHTIYPNVTLRQNGWLREEKGKQIWDAWVAALLGIEMKNMDGHPLDQILTARRH